MIEGVVGEIVDNIRKDFSHKGQDHPSTKNATDELK